MPSITALAPAKRRAGWIEIQLDGASHILLPEEDIWRLGLTLGCEIEEADLGTVQRTAELAEALRVGLRYLSVRPRSCREIELRLLRDRMPEDTVEQTVDRLAALGNPTRLQIFRLLVKAGPDGLPVGAIQNELGVPASTLSHHLRHLVSVALVSQERSGVTLICRAKYGIMQELIDFLTAECCVGSVGL